MTERDLFVSRFENEYQTTSKLLRAYPKEKSEIKPAEKSKNARELAWMLVLNQMVLIPAMKGELKPGSLPPPPANWDEVLTALDREHKNTATQLGSLTDETMSNKTIKLPVGPGKIDDVRMGDALWMFLYDTIHHRGQFTIYSRIAGARVPSIYGPTADEPWF
jgi:uncharacterized damage-inducible protein DinB